MYAVWACALAYRVACLCSCVSASLGGGAQRSQAVGAMLAGTHEPGHTARVPASMHTQCAVCRAQVSRQGDEAQAVIQMVSTTVGPMHDVI